MAVRDAEDESEFAKKELLSLLVSGVIGEGAHRRVYRVRQDPTLVLKVERFSHEFANQREWATWDELQWTPQAARWLAPCLEIGAAGLVLMQRYVRDLSEAEWEALDLVPAWLGDTRRDNWGWLEDPGEPAGGRPVMRDYSINRLAHRGCRGRRMVAPTGQKGEKG